ncbi:M23 family metallopeptidase [Candidatus Woesebacteria bacterium]|nr:MAG: M23 family metallopeptidase [Candidatus Woesebacteria bacterium]
MKQKRLILPQLHHLVYTNKVAIKALFPNPGMISSVRKGSKVSRYLRYILERIQIKKIFATNLAIMIIAANYIPQTNQPFLVGASGEITNEGEIIHTSSPLVITTNKKIQYPVRSINISQGYKIYHPGIDFDGNTGDIIYPIMSGYVEEINYSNIGYGNAAYIRHNDTTTSLYAHLSHIFVKVGTFVDFNDPIGTMGSTGRSSGDHLHLEIHINGKPTNPLGLLPGLQ